MELFCSTLVVTHMARKVMESAFLATQPRAGTRDGHVRIERWVTAAKSLQLRCAAANLESDQKGLWLNCHFLIKSCYQIYLNQILEMYTCAGLIIYQSNFILLNISYQNEHLECGQTGTTTAIPTALRPLVSYLVRDMGPYDIQPIRTYWWKLMQMRDNCHKIKMWCILYTAMT